MTVLVIAAHPDDEILGPGGTLARHAEEGDAVHILIVAEGATARENGTTDDVDKLKNAAVCAAKAIGAHPPRMLGLPDNRLDTMALLDVVRPIEDAVRKITPTLVYTHHGGDLNLDHRIVHQAVVTACRPLPDSTVRKLYGFETLSSTEWATPSMGPVFNPTHFVDISKTLGNKKAALECYASEMRPFPHPRSTEAVEALARMRGSYAGLKAAEAFEVILSVQI
ncbi:MAG: PIG-L family deacetylase [Rhodospirillales bacterium]|nr:PIG-L family deacetylase [Rhodospirillales bacterium]